MTFDLPDYETILFYNFKLRPETFTSNLKPMLDIAGSKYNFTLAKTIDDCLIEINLKFKDIEQKRQASIKSCENTVKNWLDTNKTSDSVLESIHKWEMEIIELKKDDFSFIYIVNNPDGTMSNKCYDLSKKDLQIIQFKVLQLKELYTINDEIKNGWFIVGLNLANGVIFGYLNEGLNYTKISEIIFPKKPTKVRPYISSSCENSNNDKNIFRYKDKLKYILNYCQNNNIPINQLFEEKALSELK